MKGRYYEGRYHERNLMLIVFEEHPITWIKITSKNIVTNIYKLNTNTEMKNSFSENLTVTTLVTCRHIDLHGISSSSCFHGIVLCCF